MTTRSTPSQSNPLNLPCGFIAGFLATLIFHQLIAALLWGIGLAPGAPFQFTPRPPFGVPAVISLAFWGGVWGILFAAVDHRFPRGFDYWFTAFLVGAILPTLVALLIVVPLKGGAVGAGWMLKIWIYAFLVNGAWGVGTGLSLRWLRSISAPRR